MNREDSLINISIQEDIGSKKEISSLFLNFDVIMIKILQKFYFNNNSFPNDTSCYYLQQLFSELKTEGFQINLETLRKRLETLVKLNLIEKVETYPRIYTPIRDVEKIKKLLVKVKEIFL
jgi:ssDNA-binding replication factor A large subunit